MKPTYQLPKGIIEELRFDASIDASMIAAVAKATIVTLAGTASR